MKKKRDGLINQDVIRAICNMKGPYDYSKTAAKVQAASDKTQKYIQSLRPPGVPGSEALKQLMADPEMQDLEKNMMQDPVMRREMKELIINELSLKAAQQLLPAKEVLSQVLERYNLQLPRDLDLFDDHSLAQLPEELRDLIHAKNI